MTVLNDATRDVIHSEMIPFDVANPYQKQLSEALANSGVEVSGRSSLNGMISERIRKRQWGGVVHLHWLHRFDNSLRDQLRSVLFVTRLAILKILGARLIWTVHNLYHHEVQSKSVDHWVARQVSSKASRIITHSDTARNLVIEEFDVRDDSKVVVVPHGNYIDSYRNDVSSLEAKASLGLGESSFTFLFLGHIRPYKGVIEMIESYRNCEYNGRCSLVIAGRPLDDSWAHRVRSASEGDPTIRLELGFVPDDKVQIYMNAADAVVFPYRQILTSGAVVLAMSFSKCCIAPRIGCIPDVLDVEGAFLYDPDDPNSLSEAMNSSVNAHKNVAKMGRHNFDRASAWGWNRIADQTRACYER